MKKLSFRGLLTAMVLALCCSAPQTYAQTMHSGNVVVITVSKKNLEKVLEQLGRRYGYQMYYSPSALKGIDVSVSIENMDIDSAMKVLLSGTGLQYKRYRDVIAVSPKSNASTPLVGRVTDIDGAELPGVSIFTQDMSLGASTDINGRFSFKSVPHGALLKFTSVGMKPHYVVYNGERSLQVVMQEDVAQLDAVVVTGFQTISRERSTGSATIVNKEYLDKIQAPTLSDKLEGSTPGLTTYNGNTSIRGISSFAVNSTPLLVLDGQPVTGLSIDEINPDDIENVTVLKDAAATSLYGVRASNGVIVVTTKRGTTKKANISISAGFYLNPLPSLSYQHLASTGDIIDYEIEYMTNHPNYIGDPLSYFTVRNDMNAPQYMSQVSRLYYEMAQGNLTQSEVDRQVNVLRKNDYRKEYRKELQHLALTQDYNLSISKAGDNSNLFLSARYENNGYYDKDDSSDKFTFYLKEELDLTKWLKLTVGANVGIFNSEIGQASYQGSLSAMPYDVLRNTDGSLAYQYPVNYYLSQRVGETEGLHGLGYNAIEENTKNMNDTDNQYWKLFTHADFKLLKGLTLGLKFQYEKRAQNTERYDEVDSYYMRHMIDRFASGSVDNGFAYNIPDGGHLSESHARWSHLNFRAQFDYKTSIAEKHDITALLGGEIREDKYRFTQGERYGYDDGKLTYDFVDWYKLNYTGIKGQLSNGIQKLGELLNVYDTHHRYVSAYFNAGYTYDSRYSLNASVRVEQADLFGTDPKYRYRPLWSVGASWNITNEAFMENLGMVDMLKLRMTYGITGNVDQNTSPFLLGYYIPSPFNGSNLTGISTPPNKFLRWEKTSTFNAGLDFMLFKRLSGTFDFYLRKSSDLLANKSLDPSTGFETARVNNGAMKNTGVEISLTYDWLKNKDWTLVTTLTASHNRNEITKVGYVPTDALDMMRYPTSYYLKGDTYNSLYAYRYAGLTETGDPSVYDVEGKVVSVSPVRDINALVCSGQLDPKWNGAFDLNFSWRQLNFFTKIVYYTGHSLRVDATPLYNGITYATGKIHEDIVNRWTPGNTDTDIPAMNLYGNQQDREHHWKYADYNVTNASFLKVRNIGLGYSLPKPWIERAGFKAVNLRAQINNPFYWAANNHDIDPEAFNANSGTRADYAMMPSYIFGININF